jgi:hypothetical protein
MKMRKNWLLWTICLFILITLPTFADEVSSKYAKMDLAGWYQFDTQDNRFTKPEDFLKEVDECVEKICAYLNIEFDKQINIVISERSDIAFLNRNTVYFSGTYLRMDITPIAHEVTHILVDSSIGGLNEGLAQLMQEKFGKTYEVATLGYPIHSIAKTLLEYCDLAIISGLMQGGLQYTYLNNNDRFFFYMYSYSFVKYMVENYGIVNFMYFFNNSYTESYQSVFGNSVDEIRDNWLKYIHEQEGVDLEEYLKGLAIQTKQINR